MTWTVLRIATESALRINSSNSVDEGTLVKNLSIDPVDGELAILFA